MPTFGANCLRTKLADSTEFGPKLAPNIPRAADLESAAFVFPRGACRFCSLSAASIASRLFEESPPGFFAQPTAQRGSSGHSHDAEKHQEYWALVA